MHLIESFINNIRNADGDDIWWTLFMGFMAVSLVFVAGVLIWGLVEWLGVFVVLVPFALVAILLALYGIGYVVVKVFDL